MPPRTRANSASRNATKSPAALSDADVALLRERLGNGKRPRVLLLVDTALGAAGTSVPVVRFADPAEGEFISVRLRDDVVPFSPTELTMPTRTKPAGAPVAVLPAALALDPPIEAPAPGPARLAAVPEPPDVSPAPESTAPAAAEPPTRPASRATRKPGRSGGMSVTIRFTGQAWTYESSRGGRRSAARPLNLAAVRALADRLDDPGLRRDLQGAIDICRQQARSRVETLRAELERFEIELAELDE